jgi:hypothetical protein
MSWINKSDIYLSDKQLYEKTRVIDEREKNLDKLKKRKVFR